MGWRAVLRLIGAVIWLGICLPLWAIWRLFGAEGIWTARFLAGIGLLLGLRTRERGRPLAGPALLVANHISWLDILAIGGRSEVCFVAKADIANWPIVGWLAKVGGVIFVDRTRRSDTRAQADVVTQALKDGKAVVLFPEGGTGNGITIEPFRPALFAAAVEAGCRVQPTAVDYGSRRASLAWPTGAGFGSVAKRMLNQKGRIEVIVRYLAPLDSTRLDRKALAAKSHEIITSALE